MCILVYQWTNFCLKYLILIKNETRQKLGFWKIEKFKVFKVFSSKVFVEIRKDDEK